VKLGSFIRLDILEPVDDPAADLQIRRSATLDAPALQCPGADAPAAGEIILMQMDRGQDMHSHTCAGTITTSDWEHELLYPCRPRAFAR
jgi:hypothetical protein